MLFARSQAVSSVVLAKKLFTSNIVYKCSQQVPLRSYSAPSTSNISSTKWDILGAVCLERVPIISPPMTKIEQEVSQMFETLDIMRSLKSDHELWQDQDRKIAKQLSDGIQEETKTEAATRQTAQDFEDACNEELSKFKPASRTTDADLKGDKKSTNRKLDKHLLFVVENKVEDKKIWRLPQTRWKTGETLRQTAERVLQEYVKTPETSVRILGNAPWGVHTIKYSSSVREKLGFSGAKIFFYKAQLLSQSCHTCPNVEYNWLGREELEELLEREYLRSVKQFLIDEN